MYTFRRYRCFFTPFILACDPITKPTFFFLNVIYQQRCPRAENSSSSFTLPLSPIFLHTHYSANSKKSANSSNKRENNNRNTKTPSHKTRERRKTRQSKRRHWFFAYLWPSNKKKKSRLYTNFLFDDSFSSSALGNWKPASLSCSTISRQQQQQPLPQGAALQAPAGESI